MALRITTGILKGMAVEGPKGELTRPTSARVRQAVMNTLAPYFAEARLADLFAGSGAIALEALSRGAAGAVLVENGRHALGVLEKNLEEARRRIEKAGEKADVRLLKRSVGKSWGDLEAMGPFDIIWADPPYADVLRWAPELLARSREIAKPEAVLVVESDASGRDVLLTAAKETPQWAVWKEKEYGDTFITMFLLQEDASNA